MKYNAKDLLDTVIVKCSTAEEEFTLRQYFKDLLTTLWDEKEGFSGKRPFGNSYWEGDVYNALVTAKVISGKIDEDGYLDSFDKKAANALVFKLIEAL